MDRQDNVAAVINVGSSTHLNVPVVPNAAHLGGSCLETTKTKLIYSVFLEYQHGHGQFKYKDRKKSYC